MNKELLETLKHYPDIPWSTDTHSIIEYALKNGVPENDIIETFNIFRNDLRGTCPPYLTARGIETIIEMIKE